MKRKLIILGILAGALCLSAGCSNPAPSSATQAVSEAQGQEVTEKKETEAGTEAETKKGAQGTDGSEAGTEAAAGQASVRTLQTEDVLAQQAQVEEQLLAEAQKGYTFEEPLVVVDPYGNSPLTAVAIFDTKTESGVKMVVKGNRKQDDIEALFVAEKTHILPIYGLYAGKTTQVELTLDDGTRTVLEIEADQIESQMGAGEVATLDEAVYDFSKLTFVSCGAENEIAAYDSTGTMRWFSPTSGLPFKQLSNGHFLAQTDTLIAPLYYMSGIIEFDLNGKIYKQYNIPGGSHHAAFEMPNGNLLVGSCTTDFSKVEDRIVEIDRNTGEVVYELSLEGILDPTDGGSVNRTDRDWFHNNAIWYDEATDTILLSGRHVDAVIGVNKTDKSLSWILGDPEGWKSVDPKYFFTPTGDNFEWQYAQHNVTILSNGDIMVFDNGTARTKSTKPDAAVTGDQVYSRAVAYRINTQDMTISQAWEYGKDRGAQWSSSFISGAAELGENDYWITSGGNMFDTVKKTYDVSPYDQLSPTVEKRAIMDEVKDGKLVFEMVLPSLVYRSFRAGMYPEQSGSMELTEKGQWLGSMGVTKQADVQKIDCKGAAKGGENWKLVQKPFGLVFSGTLNGEKLEVGKGFVILEDNQGNQKVYALGQTPIEQEDGSVLVNLFAFVSGEDLEGTTWHVYIQADGEVYDTGCQAEL